ncbi:MAG: hypothetical protein WA821_05480 [Anaerolineales bacterium]
MNQIKHKSIMALLLALAALLALGISLVSASGKQSASSRLLAAITPTPRRTDAFTFCAYEGGTCTVYTLAPISVRFGANGQYVFKPVASWGGSIACTVAAFGSDPVPGTAKECRYIAAPFTPATVGYTPCATENMTCPFSGTKLVRYGYNGQYVFKSATNGITCSYTTFGSDPYPYQAKMCAYAAPVPGAGWTKCADDGGSCTASPYQEQTVAYGASGKYFYKTAASGTTLTCNTTTFGGDPIVGTAKSCYTYTISASDYGTSYTSCGYENTPCAFSGTKLARYGTGSSAIYKLATNGITCSYTAFGLSTPPGGYNQCFYAKSPAAPVDGWQFCNGEGGACSKPMNSSPNLTVAYGANTSFVYKTFSAGFTCSLATFGSDPLVGTNKGCYIISESDTNGWTRCASESGTCYFLSTQLVAYGANGSYTYTTAAGSINCSVSAFGSDPIVGTAKSCYYRSNAGE